MFGRLFSLMKKHHTLSLFSTVRLHRVQSMMNLRHVLEAGAAAAFAIAHPESHHFVVADTFNILYPSKKLTNKRYKWLEIMHPAKSAWIKSIKTSINESTAHANVISGDSNFRIDSDNTSANLPFFDFEDDYRVKCDLWLIGAVGLELMDLLFVTTNDLARTGRAVIDFRQEFQHTFQGIAAENNKLLVELKSSDRFQSVLSKLKQRNE